MTRGGQAGMQLCLSVDDFTLDFGTAYVPGFVTIGCQLVLIPRQDVPNLSICRSIAVAPNGVPGSVSAFRRIWP